MLPHSCSDHGRTTGVRDRRLAGGLARARRTARRGAAPGRARWQDIVFRTIRASRPYLDVQGPGHHRLSGRYGKSGLPAEFDTAVSHDPRALTIVESKAVADYALRRDAALVLSGKIRDHEMGPGFGWVNVNPFIASAGLVGPEFCRWCFVEAIDVTDPRRFPLAVLTRLPSFVRPELGGSRLWEAHAALCNALALTAGRVEAGPVCGTRLAADATAPAGSRGAGRLAGDPLRSRLVGARAGRARAKRRHGGCPGRRRAGLCPDRCNGSGLISPRHSCGAGVQGCTASIAWRHHAQTARSGPLLHLAPITLSGLRERMRGCSAQAYDAVFVLREAIATRRETPANWGAGYGPSLSAYLQVLRASSNWRSITLGGRPWRRSPKPAITATSNPAFVTSRVMERVGVAMS